MNTTKIALVSYKKKAKYTQGLTNDEDAELVAFLAAKGLDVTYVIWNDSQVDWKAFDVAVLKSPWDYFNLLPEFKAWLDELERLGVKVLNPADVVRWNSHKGYLADVAAKGLPVIATEILPQGSTFDGRFFDRLASDNLVVKPCVSAGAENTVTVSRETVTETSAAINEGLQSVDYLVQPFVPQIKTGEWSFLFFNGQYSHCVLKTPKAGDFRVQHYYGGAISYPEPDPKHIEQAAAYLRQLSQPLLYARVDGVIIDGAFALMELELIEPYLFLNGNERLMQNYYEALIALI